jgi:hypothetical protein
VGNSNGSSLDNYAMEGMQLTSDVARVADQ